MKQKDFMVRPSGDNLAPGSYQGMLVRLVAEPSPPNWNRMNPKKPEPYVFRFTFLVWDDASQLGQYGTAIEVSQMKGAKLTQRSDPYKWLKNILGEELEMATDLEAINKPFPVYCQLQIDKS